MGNAAKNNLEGKAKNSSELPRFLNKYESFDFVIQQKVRFIFYLCISVIAGLVLIIITSSYIQVNDPIYNGLYLPVLIPELILLMVFLFSVFLLMKGHYIISSNLILISSILCIWFVMFTDKTEAISRLDSIAFLFAILSALPLFISKNKYLIILYSAVNLFILFIFVFFVKQQLAISNLSAMDFLVDSSIAMMFLGIVGYNIFRINKTSLDRAETDIKERRAAEKALAKSEKKYREMTNLLPQTVFESDLNGVLTYINKNGLELYGYTEKDFQNGVNVLSTLIEEDRKIALDNIKKVINGGPTFGNQYTAIKKDGSTFPVQIFSSVIEENEKPIGFRGIIIDITDRKLAETSLKESEEKYRTLMESINEVIVVADNNHIVQFVNRRFTEKLGYTPEEIVGKVGYKFLHDTEDYKLVEKANENRLNKIVGSYEIPFIAKNGQKIDFLVNGAPIINSSGKTVGSIGAMVDITDRKKAAQEIARTSAQLQGVLDAATEISIIAAYPNGKIAVFNKGAEKMLGYKESEVVGKKTPEFIHLECELISRSEELSREYNRKIEGFDVLIVLAQNGKRDIREWTYVCKNGSHITVSLGVTAVRDAKNEIIGYLGIAIDITEQKKSEKTLRESEEKYRSLMENMNEVVMVVDNEDRVQYVNKRFTELTGYTPEEMIGFVGYEKLLEPKDYALIQKENQKRIRKIKTQYELTFIAKDGRKIDFLVSGAPVIDSEGNTIGSIGAMIDITERKKIEKELEKHQTQLELLVNERTEELAAANEELVSTNEELYYQSKELESALNNLQNAQKQLLQAEKMASLGVLAAGVAHEINNPLNFISGGVLGLENYINDKLAKHVENVSPLIEAINLGVTRASEIVKSLNRFSRQTDSLKERCDLHSTINNCLVILNDEIKNRIKVVKEFTNEPFTIIGNDGKLHQAILNILSNSIHAIENNGTISIATSILKQMVVLTVNDTGHGIDKEDLNRIFDPFFTKKQPGEGTGLGLSITYQIIQELNGTIEYSSEKGKGTTAIISIPIDKK